MYVHDLDHFCWHAIFVTILICVVLCYLCFNYLGCLSIFFFQIPIPIWILLRIKSELLFQRVYLYYYTVILSLYQRHKMVSTWVQCNRPLTSYLQLYTVIYIKLIKHVLLTFSLITTLCAAFEALSWTARGNLPDCLFSFCGIRQSGDQKALFQSRTLPNSSLVDS